MVPAERQGRRTGHSRMANATSADTIPEQNPPECVIIAPQEHGHRRSFVEIGNPNLEDEQPAIAYFLENLDKYLAESQHVMEETLGAVRSQRYHILAATIEETIYQYIRIRTELIAWGIAMGLTGVNTISIIEEIKEKGKEVLPDVYHTRLNDLCDQTLSNPSLYSPPQQ
jgi:hypothetical protein